MELLQIVLATLVTLGIVVTIHEYGHFWVARRCGVKVLRFSIGFGKPLYRWFDKQGTEYWIASIPLGGYVKMLDEREGEVAEHELSLAFNRKPVMQRIAIVVAGPAANFILAIAVYWLYFLIGFTALKPVIGEVAPESPAAIAGLPVDREIVAIDGQATPTWREVNVVLLSRIGETGELKIETREVQGARTQITTIPVQRWLAEQEQPDILGALGIEQYMPPMPPRVGIVQEGSAAQAAGLAPNDLILAINDRRLDRWRDFTDLVRTLPGEKLEIRVERDGQQLVLSAIAERRTLPDGSIVGFLGAGPEVPDWPESHLREVEYSLFGAWLPAVQETWRMTALTAVALKKMIVGQISVKNLSGPITIAKVAGSAVDRGLIYYLNFLAYLSISLGFINILPIPVLDGGHLMYYLAELVRGKPVSEQVQMAGLRVGLVIIASLMLLALYYDILRL